LIQIIFHSLRTPISKTDIFFGIIPIYHLSKSKLYEKELDNTLVIR